MFLENYTGDNKTQLNIMIRYNLIVQIIDDINRLTGNIYTEFAYRIINDKLKFIYRKPITLTVALYNFKCNVQRL